MELKQLIDWAACFGQLQLAIVVFLSGHRSPLTVPMVTLSLIVFGWNFAATAYQETTIKVWHWLDLSISPFTVPLSLHVSLAFTGKLRRWRRLLWLNHLYFGALSLSSLLAFLSTRAAAWADSRAWSISYAAVGIPMLVLQVAHLFQYAREAPDRESRLRGTLMLVGFVVGGALMATEVLDDFIPGVLPLGDLGTLASMALFSMVVLRFNLIGSAPTLATWLYAVPLALLLFVGNAAMYQYLATNVALFLVALTLVVFAVTPAFREFVETLARERERMSRMAFLGRLSAQLAHDLRNPLTALKGAVYTLRQDEAEPEKQTYLTLMSDQVERIYDVVDRYLRLGQFSPDFEELSLNAVVRRVIEMQRLAAPEVSFQSELDEGLPGCRGDAHLLAVALENLLQNGCQATQGKGHITVSTRCGKAPSTLVLQVRDDGCGIAPEDQERVFDDFFSKRELGSGLGLSFVQRVVHAHGGQVDLKSRPGVGTVVSLTLPALTHRENIA